MDGNYSCFTKSHLANLKQITMHLKLKEYFDYMVNSLESKEVQQQEEIKQSKKKINEKVVEQKQMTKSHRINWNLNYCEKCHLSYWPNNCTVYIKPKYHMVKRHSKLNRQIKLFDYKPRLNSYKEKLVKKVIDKGISLIYECKKCKFKNLIYNEIKRKDLNCLKPSEKMKEKKFNQDLNNSFLKFNSKVEWKPSQKPNAIKKKFQSLQLKLRQNELEQQKSKEKTINSFGSLADFLEKLS